VVKLQRIAGAAASAANVNIFVKLESANPGGSVKDRMAKYMIEQALKDGSLEPGGTVIEATSGNTGIGLAMICAEKGLSCVIVMAESFSIERRKIMRALGAKVILCPAHLKGTGMVDKARELAEKHGWWWAQQFDNPANTLAHEETTAVELLEDFPPDGSPGEQLHYFVCGYGTGGTVAGVSNVLKARSPATKVVVCEPDVAPLLRSGIQQEMDASSAGREISHPSFKPHPIQGWTTDFIPKILKEATQKIDRIMPIDGGDAIEAALLLAKQEGILTGVSGGGAVSGALKIAREVMESDDCAHAVNILAVVADTGERYLSTALFDDIQQDMNEEESAISMSTPFGQFVPAPAPATASEPTGGPAPAPTQEAVLDPKAEEYVLQVLREKPVVMFSLSWCEFCWSVRKWFKSVGLEYYDVALDSEANQQDDWGIKVRAVFSSISGCKTIPQIFVGGKFLGGCTDVMAAYKSNELQKALKAAGADDIKEGVEPFDFLPKWVHRRG
jgi:cysteine synthase A